MTTIAERIKENRKRSRPIESQPEDIIYQNQDQDSNLTPQQKDEYLKNNAKNLLDHKELHVHFHKHQDGIKDHHIKENILKRSNMMVMN